MPYSKQWRPTQFIRFENALDTSMGTARVVTDAGKAYLKGMGNRQGPHPLACEWVAAQLADWFGLPTFDYSIIEVDADFDEIPFIRGGCVASGPAFVSRATPGHPWGGLPVELESLANPEMISHLVIFDTWIRNCDRHPPDLNTRKPNRDNVFIADANPPNFPGPTLFAMDHSHCFTCGRDLDDKVARIELVKDSRIFGLFPEFQPFVTQEAIRTAIARLDQVRKSDVAEVVESIPPQWEVSPAARNALIELICQRAPFVAATVDQLLKSACWPDQLFDSPAHRKKRNKRK